MGGPLSAPKIAKNGVSGRSPGRSQKGPFLAPPGPVRDRPWEPLRDPKNRVFWGSEIGLWGRQFGPKWGMNPEAQGNPFFAIFQIFAHPKFSWAEIQKSKPPFFAWIRGPETRFFVSCKFTPRTLGGHLCTSAAKQWSIGADFRKLGSGPGPGSGPGSGLGPGWVREGPPRDPKKGPKMALFWGLLGGPKKGLFWPFFGTSRSAPIELYTQAIYSSIYLSIYQYRS